MSDVLSAPAAAQPAVRAIARLSAVSDDLVFSAGIVAAYALGTYLAINHLPITPDRMVALAERVLAGHLDAPSVAGTVDSVAYHGRFYLTVGPAQLVPYLPFVSTEFLREASRFAICLAFGLPAALLALPLARAYGARGSNAYWVALFTAMGTLLWLSSVTGNMYYLAAVESFLALELFLLEWAGSRRPLVLASMLGLSFLARPTTLLAAIPFGLALLWDRRAEVRSLALSAAGMALPIGLALIAYGWFDWARFGDPLQSGYGMSFLSNPGLQASRAEGLFSIAHLPQNLNLALLALPATTNTFPFYKPSVDGMSMLLVSPALFTAIWADFHDRTTRLLWIATALVAIPDFLYYGGGLVQYGFRYSLDFTPFLIALMAMGANRWTGWPERLLVVFSVVSVALGLWWRLSVGP